MRIVKIIINERKNKTIITRAIIEAEKESCGIYQAHIDLIKSALAKAEKP
jgi:hypothetical protein